MLKPCLAVAVALVAAACVDPDVELRSAALIEPAVPLVLPVEVMPTAAAGFGELVTPRTFALTPANLAALQGGGSLYLQGHGLGYRDGHTQRDGKASIKLNGGPWVRLENANPDIAVAYPERKYDGIGGGFRTVRMTISLATLCAGASPCLALNNTIRFKFHGSDGTSSGYRIIDLDLLDGDDVRVFDAVLTEDPESWGEPAPGDPDITAGEQLWRARGRLEAWPGGADMIASCSDCHAQDGSDLEYFAFSDRSIISRAVFHGLDATEGAQIAKYIRSLPDARRGRPWNPPYQPGPDHDDGNVDAWAAGAGLDDVLDREDASTLAALLPHGNASTVSQLVDAIRGDDLDPATGLPRDARTINLRELPIAIQLPDWNSWLPEIHPIDLWGECTWASGELEGCAWSSGLPPPSLVYEGIRAELENVDGDGLPLEPVPFLLGGLIVSVVRFVETGWVSGEAGQDGLRTQRGAMLDLAVQHGYSSELVKRSLAQWTAVKYWELMHEFDLEHHGKDLYGAANGEALEWPTGGYQSVFFVAPHITSNNQNNYTVPGASDDDNACFEDFPCAVDRHNAQTSLKGDYDSSAWYQLQLVLHAGARSLGVPDESAVSPIDWPYVLEHIDDLARHTAPLDDPPWESVRYLAAMMKAYQMRDNGMGPSLIGWSMRDISPRLLVSSFRGHSENVELLTHLDELGDATLRARVTEAFLIAFLTVVNPADDARFASASWPRITLLQQYMGDDRASWWRLDRADRVPDATPDGGLEFPSQGFYHHADHMCRALPLFRALTIDQTLVDDFERWAESMWPGPGEAPQDFGTLCP